MIDDINKRIATLRVNTSILIKQLEQREQDALEKLFITRAALVALLTMNAVAYGLWFFSQIP